ncbi:MAG: hypothetical protein K2X28_08745 [Alphaproteobacteria bacterium]|nr:hypothetical protein [Alphaproteobacteria bacterium]
MRLKTFVSSFVLSLLMIQSSAFSMSESEEERLRQISSTSSQHKLSDFQSPRGQHVFVNGKLARHSKVMKGEVESIIVDPNNGGSLTVKGWTAFKGKGPAEAIVAFSNRLPVALIPSSESSDDIAGKLAAKEGDQFTKADYSRCRFNARFSYPDVDALGGEDLGYLKFYAFKDNEGGYIKIARRAFTFKELLLDPKSTIEADHPAFFGKLIDTKSSLEVRISAAQQFPADRQLEAFCTLLSDRELIDSQREFIMQRYTFPEKVSAALKTINDSTQVVSERLRAVRRLPELTRVRVLGNLVNEISDPSHQLTTEKEDLEIELHNTLVSLPRGGDTEAFLTSIVNRERFPLFARFSAAFSLPNGDEFLLGFFGNEKLTIADRREAAEMIKDEDLKIKCFQEMVRNPNLGLFDRIAARIKLDRIHTYKDVNDEDFKSLIMNHPNAQTITQSLQSCKSAFVKLGEAKQAEAEAIQRGDIRVLPDGRLLLVKEY